MLKYLGVLTLLLVTLRLTEVIDWSWWWVLAPAWIPVAGVVLIGFLFGLVDGAMVFSASRRGRTNRTGRGGSGS